MTLRWSFPTGLRGKGSARNTTRPGFLYEPSLRPHSATTSCSSQLRAVVENHLGQRGLAPSVVRNAEYHDLADPGHGGDDLLQLGRPDVEAAGDDHVVDPVDDVQEAVLVQSADVI